MRKVIITGGRNYSDYAMVADTLDFLKPDLIIQGGASGADFLAIDYAVVSNINRETYCANWKEFGNSAGPRRNREMLDAHPDAIVVAFKGGVGTENCIQEAVKRNMLVLRVEP